MPRGGAIASATADQDPGSAGAVIEGTAEPFLAGVAGALLSETEMEEATGALHVRGVRVRNRARRSRRRSFRPRNRNNVHCDIIARNRAEALGLDTDAGPGARMDFNNVTVAQIYSQYRGRGTATPRPGTAGYIFTASDGSKGHLQVYDARGTGAGTYRRYTNGSYAGTERMSTHRDGYVPDRVTAQRFVPIPRRAYYTVWSR